MMWDPAPAEFCHAFPVDRRHPTTVPCVCGESSLYCDVCACCVSSLSCAVCGVSTLYLAACVRCVVTVLCRVWCVGTQRGESSARVSLPARAGRVRLACGRVAVQVLVPAVSDHAAHLRRRAQPRRPTAHLHARHRRPSHALYVALTSLPPRTVNKLTMALTFDSDL